MTDDAERAAFEAHARASNWPLVRKEISNRETKANIYECPGVQASWYSWQARAEIARREAGGWQSIESAPRDGSVILIKHPIVSRPTMGLFRGEPYHSRGSYGWRISIHPGDAWAWVVQPPTHWMLLPAPPAPLAAPP